MQKICLIVPCYNEEKRLRVEEFEEFVRMHPEYDFLFVNDGSTDGTSQILRLMSGRQSHLQILELPVNGGKAEAIRQGVLRMCNEKYDQIGYFDADLATPLSEIPRLSMTLETHPEYKIVLGSRWKRLGAFIKRNLFRHYLGRIFATVVSYLFRMEIYDTQCGAKILVNQDLDKIFEKPFCSSWFFDLEILIRMREFKINTPMDSWAIEVPLDHWQEIGGSKIKWTDFLRVPVHLWKIKKHYRV